MTTAPLRLIETPADVSPASLLEPLLAAARLGNVGAVLLVRRDNDAAALTDLAQHVMRPLQAMDIAVLIRGSAKLANSLGADGAELTPADDLAAVRRLLGDRSLGVDCGQSRHDAMLAGEAGADYVRFGPIATPEDVETVHWWSLLMTVPCVAGNIAPDMLAAVMAAQPEFMAETV